MRRYMGYTDSRRGLLDGQGFLMLFFFFLIYICFIISGLETDDGVHACAGCSCYRGFRVFSGGSNVCFAFLLQMVCFLKLMCARFSLYSSLSFFIFFLFSFSSSHRSSSRSSQLAKKK